MGKLERILKERILILDGATGAKIQNHNLNADDFGGEKYFGCNEYLNIINPKIIEEIHEKYLEAGADIIKTNTFGALPHILKEYDLEDKIHEIVSRGIKTAKKKIKKYSSLDKPRFVAANIGPGNKFINLSKNCDFNEIYDLYGTTLLAVLKAKPHIILLENFPDTSNLKAVLCKLQDLSKEHSLKIPKIMINVTIENNGKMLAGQNIEALFTSIKHFEPLSVGINYDLGAKQVLPNIKKLSKYASTFTSIHPNAGLEYSRNPKDFALELREIFKNSYVNIIGGYYGTTPNHIKDLASLSLHFKPRKIIKQKIFALSEKDNLILEKNIKPVQVGERTNISGSTKFRDLIREKKFKEASKIAKIQVKKGAQIIDVNLNDTKSNEAENIDNFYPLILIHSKVPVMIDSSSSSEIIEKALKKLQGKSIINSVSMQNPQRLKEIAKLSKKYGAALITLLIDENKMAITVQEKVDLAILSYNVLTKECGIKGEDIIFDPLVFPLASEDELYYLCAANTLEAIKQIRKKFRKVKFSLGISNASFGLPNPGREALNSVYLYEASKAGLDMAIVNSEKIIKYSSLTKNELKLCKAILYKNNSENINNFISYYSKNTVENLEAKKKYVETNNGEIIEEVPKHIVKMVRSYKESNLQKHISLELDKAQIPIPDSFEYKVLKNINFKDVLPYMDLQSLFSKHLGLKGNIEELKNKKDKKFLELQELYLKVSKKCINKKLIKPKAVYKFFKCRAEGNTILIFDDNYNLIESFSFPISKKSKLSLASYISKKEDTVGFLVVTASNNHHREVNKLKRQWLYKEAHILSSIALETAEATARYIHIIMRQSWGINNKDKEEKNGIKPIHNKYKYPSLFEQKKVNKLLKAQSLVGVKVNKFLIPEPLSSVSAFVLHHPEA